MRIIRRCGAALLLASHLAACVSTEEMHAHHRSIEAWERVEVARAQANARRFEALTEVARRGDTVAQVAVAFAVSGGGGGSLSLTSSTPLPTVPDAESRAFRWASIIVPTVTMLGSGYFGYKLGVAQSNNSARMSESSYGAIRDLGAAGFGAVRDVSRDSSAILGALPHGTFLTINGNGNAAAIGGSATLDQSRRCAPSNSLAGNAGAGGAGGAGGAAPGGVGGVGGAAPTFTLPFTC